MKGWLVSNKLKMIHKKYVKDMQIVRNVFHLSRLEVAEFNCSKSLLANDTASIPWHRKRWPGVLLAMIQAQLPAHNGHNVDYRES